MISLEQISGEIAALEEEKPTYVSMQKLANLYIVRDHMILEPVKTVTQDYVTGVSDSEFSKAISGKSVSEVMKIVDELMDTIMVVNPKLYDSVLRKL